MTVSPTPLTILSARSAFLAAAGRPRSSEGGAADPSQNGKPPSPSTNVPSTPPISLASTPQKTYPKITGKLCPPHSAHGAFPFSECHPASGQSHRLSLASTLGKGLVIGLLTKTKARTICTMQWVTQNRHNLDPASRDQDHPRACCQRSQYIVTPAESIRLPHDGEGGGEGRVAIRYRVWTPPAS
jgi:hypothetical protein